MLRWKRNGSGSPLHEALHRFRRRISHCTPRTPSRLARACLSFRRAWSGASCPVRRWPRTAREGPQAVLLSLPGGQQSTSAPEHGLPCLLPCAVSAAGLREAEARTRRCLGKTRGQGVASGNSCSCLAEHRLRRCFLARAEVRCVEDRPGVAAGRRRRCARGGGVLCICNSSAEASTKASSMRARPPGRARFRPLSSADSLMAHRFGRARIVLGTWSEELQMQELEAGFVRNEIGLHELDGMWCFAERHRPGTGRRGLRFSRGFAVTPLQSYQVCIAQRRLRPHGRSRPPVRRKPSSRGTARGRAGPGSDDPGLERPRRFASRRDRLDRVHDNVALGYEWTGHATGEGSS